MDNHHNCLIGDEMEEEEEEVAVVEQNRNLGNHVRRD